MKRSTIVSAIDIGTTKVAAIIGKKDETGSIQILGYGDAVSLGVKHGDVINIDDTVAAIKAAVSKAENMAGMRITRAYVGIAGRHIKSVKNRGSVNVDPLSDVVTQHDYDQLMKSMKGIPLNPGEEIIDILPQNFTVDNETDLVSPVGICGRRVEGIFHIVIGQTTSCNNIKKCVNKCDIEVIDLVLEPLASSRATLSDEEKEIGVAMVDIGGGTTDIAIYYDKMIRHTAVIPFGGYVITKDIRNIFNLLEKQAEQLKLAYGSAVEGSPNDDFIIAVQGIKGREPKEIAYNRLASVIQARVDEIFNGVAFHIENSGYGDRMGAGIVLTGGGSLLKNLTQRVTYLTGKDIKIGYPNEHVKCDQMPEINHPRYSTLIGLLLQGFDRSKDFNFVEEEFSFQSNNFDFQPEPVAEEPVAQAEIEIEEEPVVMQHEAPEEKEEEVVETKSQPEKKKKKSRFTSLFQDLFVDNQDPELK